MSGGVAYVWNPDGNFDFYCNMDMVELALLEDEREKEDVLTLLKTHCRLTGSSIAEKMTEDWDNYSRQFIKVVPAK